MAGKSRPYVVGVGGTTLLAGLRRETAWNASGSRGAATAAAPAARAASSPLPAYQTVALGGSYAAGGPRPTSSSVGNPNTGVAVYDSVAGDGSTGWAQVGGTSAGAPVWAGIIAAADQARWRPAASRWARPRP